MSEDEVDEWRERATRLREETPLSTREAEVQALKELGYTHEEVAEVIGSTKSAVDNYSTRITEKARKAANLVVLIHDAGAVSTVVDDPPQIVDTDEEPDEPEEDDDEVAEVSES